MGIFGKKLQSFDLLVVLLLLISSMVIFRIFIVKTPMLRKGEVWVTLEIKLNNQPPWVDEAIKVGESEFLGKKEIAKIIDKKSIPTQAATDFDVRWVEYTRPDKNPRLMIFDLPVYKENRDIFLMAKVLARNDIGGGLEFKGYSLKINETIEIETKPINIYGVVIGI